MGLSIHFSGFINDKRLIEPLTEEVEGIAKTLGWSTKILHDDEIYGICFAPGKSEPVFLTFNHDGRLLSPVNIMVKEIYDDVRFDKDLIYTASVKTQFAGFDAHIAIINLLKYISEKYFISFNLSDEGKYWETGDKKILLAQFNKYNAAIDSFISMIENMSAIPGETPESLADRLEKILKQKFRKKGNGNKPDAEI